MVQVLCFYLMLYPLHAINLNMLQVAGRSDLYLRLEIIKDVLLVIPLVLGVTKGIYWMLWGYVLLGFVAYWLNARYSGRFVGYGFWQQVKDILPGFGIAAVSSAAAWTITLLPLHFHLQLAMQAVIGSLLAFGLCEWFSLPEYKELKNIATNALRSRHTSYNL